MLERRGRRRSGWCRLCCASHRPRSRSNRPSRRSRPALLKAMSRPPNVPTASSTERLGVGFVARRRRPMRRAEPPASTISATSVSSSASRRAATMTLAPCSANSFAVAWPMPELAPVTMATFPMRLNMMLPCSQRAGICRADARSSADRARKRPPETRDAKRQAPSQTVQG